MAATSIMNDEEEDDEDRGWDLVLSHTSPSSATAEVPCPPQPSSTFPTTLAHLQPSHDPARETIYKALKSIRKATLSIHNRLASIVSDSAFVQSVADHYGLSLIANERCGSWYIPMHLKAGSAYFKSTDGHHGQWSFSTRRLNLELLRMLGERSGGVLVDSTRRGKSVPDALSKTVPIWVMVVNRVLFPEQERWGKVEVWDGVSENEVAQIEARMEGWERDLRGLVLDLERLRAQVARPVKVVYAVNGEWEPDEDGEPDGESNLLVLCSASRRVRGAEASEGGYIQGSGDDHEGWSCGLTPDVFWSHQKILMAMGEEGLPELIRKLMTEKHLGQGAGDDALCIEATGTIWIAKESKDEHAWDLVINCQGDGERNSSARVLGLKCRQAKLGSKDLREKLTLVQSFAATTLERKRNCRILITCDSGKDLSVGVAVALLCLCYGDDGTPWTVPLRTRVMDKHLVKKRLAWITLSKPDANPSRATLQAVNSFLMDRPG